MRRVREHVHHPGHGTAVTGLLQHTGVARQGGRVAAHVHNALGRGPGLLGGRGPAVLLARLEFGQGLHQGVGAFARGVYQPFVGGAIAHQHLGGHLKQITRYKFVAASARPAGAQA
jgi:hypothetical protein